MIVESGGREMTAEFVGGRLCLDFANTVHAFGVEESGDDLPDVSAWIAWTRRVGAIAASEARQLESSASKQAHAADAALACAKSVRAAVYGMFSSIAAGRAARADDLATLNASVAETMAHARVTPKGDGFVWAWEDSGGRLDALLWPIVRSAADLLASPDLARVRECAGETCSWLFVDTSKNQSRRWCDMKVCGNRSKVARFHRRRKRAN
ncbi:MAG: ABATE domain-containing protein [Planctomycetes bacterium]|nr:ABATE domain-containing protein [Planctomycetota bacterium]MBI3846994.1 ABATE domain-containing protein [Planctomycetota bacterium]